MKYLTILLIFAILLFSSNTQVTLPVSKQIVTKVTLSIKYLQEALQYFGTWHQDKFLIFQRVELTKYYLLQLSNALCQYNNVVAGSGNNVVGNKNIVIGNYNNIQGNNNWVFVSQFTGKINGDLLIGNWRIELEKSYLIPFSPRFAISLINDPRNDKLRTKYVKNRQLCKWDKWTHPENQVSDSHWKRYSGYSDWKTTFQNTWGLNRGRNTGGSTWSWNLRK